MTNRRGFVACVVFFAVVFLAGTSAAAIPSAERDALITLYNSTGGPGWSDSSNWLDAPGTECGWVGVACSGGDANVVELDLPGNNLAGVIPHELMNLTLIEAIRFPDNQLTGEIPSELSTLSALHTLDLPNNQLIGGIPPELGILGALEFLHLGHNQLSGAIPPELGLLTNLFWFGANDNRLSGVIPPAIGGMVSLQEIHLWGNELTGEIPVALASLPELRWVDLAANDLTGSIPVEFGGAMFLGGLILSDNQLEGSIPPELGLLANLGHLDLVNNRLTGPIPPELGDLGALGFLNLGHNELTGNIPPQLGSLGNLDRLMLNDNRLEGEIPSQLGNLGMLVELAVWQNNLTGSIPPEIGDLGSLEILDLSRNYLTGPIPGSIGMLNSLQFLAIDRNALTGAIPSTISGLTSLGELHLLGNLLEGTIPPEIGSLPALRVLNLSSNRLEGQIPVEFGNLGNLQWFGLRANNLTGPVPGSITGLTALNDNESDLARNGLYSTDPGVTAFLDQKCGDHWDDEQTVTPDGFGVVGSTAVSVTLGWNPIAFSWLSGGYDIVVSGSPSGPFIELGRAIGKSADGWTVYGLAPNLTYYFKIRSVTDAGAENQNTVMSEFTAPEPAMTGGTPATWYASSIGVVGNDCATPATPCPTILSALDLAGPGEVVQIAPGTYAENLPLDFPVMLVGEDAATTIIEGHGWGPVVDIQTGAHAHISGLTIRGGQVHFGAGVHVAWRGRLVLEDSVVAMNQAQVQGGGVYVDCDGSAILSRVSVHDNHADERGGGVAACGALSLTDSRVEMNTASWGGGVATSGDMAMVVRTSIADNTAVSYSGGGVINEGQLAVDDSTISGNSASPGGGIMNHWGARIRLNNSTISGNTGGGVFNDRNGSVVLDNCTVVGNVATVTEDSGVSNWNWMGVHNTIIAGNLPVNCANPVRSYGYNLEDDASCNFDGPGDLVDVDPVLGPLADNGGPTMTHALSAASPAVDAGNPVLPLAADQRGYLRPVDGNDDGISIADIGAVEFAEPLFFDDFETGDTSNWTITSP